MSLSEIKSELTQPVRTCCLLQMLEKINVVQ